MLWFIYLTEMEVLLTAVLRGDLKERMAGEQNATLLIKQKFSNLYACARVYYICTNMYPCSRTSFYFTLFLPFLFSQSVTASDW